MNRLSNKVAVITGGNSGIGLATAERFVAEGAHVVLFGRDAKTLAAATGQLGPEASAVIGDVTSATDLARLFDAVRTQHGRIDVLFVNAGIAEFLSVEQANDDHYDRQFEINVKGAYRTIQGALPLIGAGGSIVLNTSVVSHLGLPGASVYSATKAALRSFARTLSAELVARGIRVNAVAPGPIETPIFEKMGMPVDQIEGAKSGMAAGVPLKRLGIAAEVAAAVAFLAAPESAYVVGVELTVSGGMGEL